MAEENSNLNTQRPIGIKPITIKPMQPPAQNPAPAAAESAAEAPTIRPLSINVAPAAGRALNGGSTNATIRLKPVISLNQTGVLQSPPSASPIQPMRPQTIQPSSIRPSIIPTPEAAAKSKTARISLDSALGETPALQNLQVGGIIPPAPVGKITSNLTADSLSINKGQTAKVSLPLQSPESEITRRRTLRVKAAATSSPESEPIQEKSSSEAPTVKKKSFVFKKDKAEAEAAAALNDATAPAGEGQISAFSAFQTAPVAKTNPVFPVLAFVAVFMIIALSVLYMSQACGPDRSLTAFSSFLGMPSPSWPGKVLTF